MESKVIRNSVQPVGPTLEAALAAYAAVAYRIRDTRTTDNRTNRVARRWRFASLHDRNIKKWSKP